MGFYEQGLVAWKDECNAGVVAKQRKPHRRRIKQHVVEIKNGIVEHLVLDLVDSDKVIYGEWSCYNRRKKRHEFPVVVGLWDLHKVYPHFTDIYLNDLSVENAAGSKFICFTDKSPKYVINKIKRVVRHLQEGKKTRMLDIERNFNREILALKEEFMIQKHHDMLLIEHYSNLLNKLEGDRHVLI